MTTDSNFSLSQLSVQLCQKHAAADRTNLVELIIYPLPSTFPHVCVKIKSLSGSASLFSLHMLSERGCLATVTLETALLSASLIVSPSFRIALCIGFGEKKAHNSSLWLVVKQSKQPDSFESESRLVISFGCKMHLLCRPPGVHCFRDMALWMLEMNYIWFKQTLSYLLMYF